MPFLWTEDSNVSKTDPERRYAGRQWTRAIDEIKVFGQPAFTISGFLGGRHGIDMETLTDEEVIANMTSIIGQFTKLAVPQPLKLLRGQWHSNPNFRGTHSYISENFFENGFKLADLAEPEWTYDSLISGTKVSALLFAGEATHDTYFSHVTGAVDSGIREASRIIKYYSRDTSTPAPGTGSPAPGGSGLSLHQTNLIVLVIMFAVVIYQQL
ncbi:putative Spermine oxidase [Hypsibius exemplaris]|uniref:Spermine oxidase n=1 Tax=Hypsibius exemplaris TaxID=2072580 RepID=A0A9X6RL97_HYPEX|nr:putative Spermine oxidase [Hypsibius exemplaris]